MGHSERKEDMGESFLGEECRVRNELCLREACVSSAHICASQVSSEKQGDTTTLVAYSYRTKSLISPPEAAPVANISRDIPLAALSHGGERRLRSHHWTFLSKEANQPLN